MDNTRYQGDCENCLDDSVSSHQGTHSGVCRGCGTYQTDLSNEDGWCGDCN